PRRGKRLGLDGYIHVEQDIRGRFGSEGAFDMNRPPHSGHAGTDESSDTYDTIDWLVKSVPNNNGRVGIFGISYPGWLTAVAGIGAHPALKAISPQAPMGDRKSTRLNSSHGRIPYAVFCLKNKRQHNSLEAVAG